MECGGRGRDVPLPPHHAHRHIDRARHDPDRSHDILGTDVLRDHGWIAGRDRVDVDLPPGAVHCLVSGEATWRHGLSAQSGYRSPAMTGAVHRSKNGPLMYAHGMVRPCSGPTSRRSWEGAPKTRSTPCHLSSMPESP